MIFGPEQQLILPIPENERSDFEHFYVSKSNLRMITQLKALTQGDHILLIGPEGAGCSHLLKACCFNHPSLNTMYIPLKLLNELSVNSIKDLQNVDLIALDDFEQTQTDILWQEALFELINHCKRHNITLIIGGHDFGGHLKLWKDLYTRLQGMLLLNVTKLTGEDIQHALEAFLATRDLNCSSQIIAYLIKYISRDFAVLKELLLGFDAYCMQRKSNMSMHELRTYLRRP
ncbi:MAG: hypothetical protein CMF41_04590 [Legionellales bacterium]|nr:hypothetical protein [Legionellales bacterium]OUX64862.1 MAG: hypothetical protein CBE41_02505 [Gammaproteobacteria bacterium TMED281]